MATLARSVCVVVNLAAVEAARAGAEAAAFPRHENQSRRAVKAAPVRPALDASGVARLACPRALVAIVTVRKKMQRSVYGDDAPLNNKVRRLHLHTRCTSHLNKLVRI